MTAKDNFLAVQAELAAHDARQNLLYEERWAIQERINKAFSDFLIEEKILGQKKWRLIINENYFYLQCEEQSDSWKELADFAESNYHCSYVLLSDNENNNAELRFDDGDISIKPKDTAHLKYLIETFGLQVVLAPHIFQTKEKMKMKIAQIEEWEKILNKEE